MKNGRRKYSYQGDCPFATLRLRSPPPTDPPSSITAIVLARHPPLFFILSTKVERSATSPVLSRESYAEQARVALFHLAV